MPLLAKIYNKFIVLLCVWGVVAALAPTGAGADNALPFAPGEKLRFALMWTVVPAGEAVLEVMPMKTIDGQKAFHFRLTAKSNAFVDLFYKVRDRIDAYASADMRHALQYFHKQREGSNRKDVKIRFDPANLQAFFSDGHKNKTTDIPTGTFDPLGAFYFSRLAKFSKDGVIVCPVSDGNKCVQGEVRIVRQETIEIISGTYDTYLIEPDMKHVGGVFEKEKDAKIRLWITADEHRIPVKIASKVAVGSFVGELMTIERGDS